MHVHRSVGQVTFVTCDMVLGAPGEASELKGILSRLEPETIAVDLSVEDLGEVVNGKVDDPFLAAQAEALEEDAETPVLLPYQRLLAWADDHDVDLHPIASRSSVGLVKARRIKRTVKRAEGAGPEEKARAALEDLGEDAQVGPLTERRRTSLAETLGNLLRREPPRTVAFFTFPWGEMVSADVRRSMGLRRVEGEQLAGGWPD